MNLPVVVVRELPPHSQIIYGIISTFGLHMFTHQKQFTLAIKTSSEPYTVTFYSLVAVVVVVIVVDNRYRIPA